MSTSVGASAAEIAAEPVHLAFYTASGDILQEVFCARGVAGLQGHPNASGSVEVPPGFPRHLAGHYKISEGVLVPAMGAACVVGNQVAVIEAEAAAMLAAGLTVTFSANSALSGTYATDSLAQAKIQAEILAILANGTFANKLTTLDYPDIDGVPHPFDIASFRSLATEVAAFVSALISCMGGESLTLPPAQVTV